MKFDTIEAIREGGFSGFKTAPELRQSELSDVPSVSGVYMVCRDPAARPVFAAKSRGGRFKGKDPTVDLATLEVNWVPGSAVLYIGKAGGGESLATLRKRLKSYLRFGGGDPVGHWGGRLIWQLEDPNSLLFCWRPAGDTDARELERELLQEFIRTYGVRPFANLRD